MRCFTCRKSFSNKEEFAAHRLHHQKMKNALRSNRKVGSRSGSKARKDSRSAKENKRKGRPDRPDKPMHECPTCSKVFSKASLLARHATIHTGESLADLEEMMRSFESSRGCLIQLEDHRIVISGEKKFSCEVCGRRFTQEVTVRAHMAVHTGERPFECPFCEAKFAQKSNLRAHVSRLHPMGGPEGKIEVSFLEMNSFHSE